MFGGQEENGTFDQSLWSFASGKWTEIIPASSCASVSCPSGRVQAGFAYDQADHEAVLFGGVVSNLFGPFALSDTWTYADGVWTNVTPLVGTPPSPRYDVAMSYISAEQVVLLFGGSDASGHALGDTWTFAAGSWTNLTPYLTQSPEPRSGASLADSPTGYAGMFGGYGTSGLIQNDPSSNPCPHELWWFHDAAWSPATYSCVASPKIAPALTGSGGALGPCGRIGAMFTWSPRNHLFVVFGGFGVPASGGCPTTGSLAPLNDTWVFAAAPGIDFQHWIQDSTPATLTPRAYLASAPDYVDGYALVFGGTAGGSSTYSDTWRYYALVSATFAGPSNLTAGSFGFWGTGYFLLRAFGGSGSLDYIFNTTELKTVHALYGNGSCANFTDHQGASIPASFTVLLQCQPGPQSYNVYRISVTVWDAQNATARAYANWTVTIAPAEQVLILPHYVGYFYAGFDLGNWFEIYAQIADQPVTQLSVTIGGRFVSATSASNDGFWYNVSFNMVNAGPGDSMDVTASISDWSDSANLSFTYVSPPDFVQQLASLAGYVDFTTPYGHDGLQTTVGHGVHLYGDGYVLTQQVPFNLAKLFNFSIPVPFVSGNYSIVPNAALSFTESSTGDVAFTGSLGLALPSISLGGFRLAISVTFKVVGKLAIAPENGSLALKWVSADVSVAINADFNANIPVWGYKFSVFGYNLSLGFNIDIDINPSFVLSLLLNPTSNASQDIVSGINLMVTKVLGELSLPISVTANFGIGIAEISAGGKLGCDVIFQISPGSFQPNNLWVNGSVYGKIRFLVWSATWNILGPGILYYAHNTGGQFLRPHVGTLRSGYDGGANATWTTDPRTYNTTGYDSLVWPGGSNGVAISDIYPEAAPSAAGAYDGAYVFYSNDDVRLPAADALTVSGLRLDASSSNATEIALPKDPGYLTTQPRAATLPDGSLLVGWDALPTSQASGGSPSGVSTLAVHAARYTPWDRSWGPVLDLTSSGISDSFAIDPTVAGGRVAVLSGAGLVPNATAPETLTVYDPTTGASVSQTHVVGLARVSSVRSALGLATVVDLSGNTSTIQLSDGTTLVPADGAPANGTRVGGGFLPGSASKMLFWYRLPTGSEAIVYDAGARTRTASIPLSGDVTDVEGLCAGANCTVAAANRTGIARWSLAGGSLVAEDGLPVAHLTSFGIVQSGGSELYYGLLARTSGPDAVKDLFVGQIGSALPAVTAGAPASHAGGGAPPGTSNAFNLWLYLGAPLAVAVAVPAVLLLLTRRKPPATPAAGPSPASDTPPPADPSGAAPR